MQPLLVIKESAKNCFLYELYAVVYIIQALDQALERLDSLVWASVSDISARIFCSLDSAKLVRATPTDVGSVFLLEPDATLKAARPDKLVLCVHMN